MSPTLHLPSTGTSPSQRPLTTTVVLPPTETFVFTPTSPVASVVLLALTSLPSKVIFIFVINFGDGLAYIIRPKVAFTSSITSRAIAHSATFFAEASVGPPVILTNPLNQTLKIPPIAIVKAISKITATIGLMAFIMYYLNFKLIKNMDEEKILTINIRKEILKKARWKRAKHAISIFRKILERHVKTKVKISKEINELIWARGIKKPLNKLRIRLVKVDDFYEARLMK